MTSVTGCGLPHLDEAYARARGLKAPVAHGMWTASLVSNLLGNRLPGAGTVYLGQELRFRAPVFLGDTVTATVTVAAKEADGRTVRLDCCCTNRTARRCSPASPR